MRKNNIPVRLLLGRTLFNLTLYVPFIAVLCGILLQFVISSFKCSRWWASSVILALTLGLRNAVPWMATRGSNNNKSNLTDFYGKMEMNRRKKVVCYTKLPEKLPWKRYQQSDRWTSKTNYNKQHLTSSEHVVWIWLRSYVNTEEGLNI